MGLSLKIIAVYGLLASGAFAQTPPSGGYPGGYQGVPQGGIIMILSGMCPTLWTEVSALNGFTVIGTIAANGDVGTSGGSDTITPAGSVAAPTFTGNQGTTSAVSAGTPAGTNASGAFSEGALSWPAAVPTNASGAFSEGAISWPAAVPTAANESSHNHELPWQIPSTTTIRQIAVGTFGTGTSRAATAVSAAGTANTTSAAVALSGPGSAHTHVLSWPASVPSIAAGVFTQPTISWPASVPTIAAGVFTQPTFSGSALATHTHTLTPAGSNSAPTFTGNQFDNRSAFVKVIFCSRN